MAKPDITSVRSTLEFQKQEGELVEVKALVDPIHEVAAIEKALENGPTLLFENVKGYPKARCAANTFSTREKVAKLLGMTDIKRMKFKCLEAIKNPVPPKVVKNAPCQQVVITDNLDVLATLPVMKQTERDAGRILSGGNTLLCGEHFRGGTHISFNRMHFRGKDWSSISTSVGSHMEEMVAVEHRGKRIPVTINISPPPAVTMVAAGAGIHILKPAGTDELGIAGAIQGSPIEICKAKTVDAYAIANAEWVIEGYIDASKKVWESDEAEKLGKPGATPFFPEWTGYLGKAFPTFRFQATAITHREDRPIFHTILSHGIDSENAGFPIKEAYFFEMADRFFPGLVIDVNSFSGLTAWGGVVFQVRKRRPTEEGFQRNILITALSQSHGLRMAIAVDEDVNIYSPEDVLWAMTTRVDPAKDIINVVGRGHAYMPLERAGDALKFTFVGSMGFDATVPLEVKGSFERPHFSVDKIDLRKWFSEAEIAAARAQQGEYARVIAEDGR